MRRLRIVHRTRYEFPESVRLGPHRLLLRPREGHELHIESSLLDTSPIAKVHWLRDIYDNSVAIATFSLPASAAVLRPYLVDAQAPVEQEALRSWLSQRWQFGEQVQTYVLLKRMCVDIKETLQ